MTMLYTCIPFPSSGDKENVPVTRGEKRTRRNALVGGTKSSMRPLLHVISRGKPITILTNPARTQAHSVPPTIHEEETPSPLSTICRPPSPSPESPRAYSVPSVRLSRSPPRITIISDLEREKREAHPRSPPKPKSILINPARTSSAPSVSQSRSLSHITILSDPESEKREAHPLSPSSVRQSGPPPHITILSNPEKEKREAHPLSTQRIKSIQNALAAALSPKPVPTISITPISILKAPTPPPQIPAPAPAADPSPNTGKEHLKVNFVLSEILIQETGQGIHDLEIGTGIDTTLTSSGEMLGVPLVDWRGRLEDDELARYYPKEHSKEQFAQRLRSMVRSGHRSAAARRRDQARRCGQTGTTVTGTTTGTPPSIALIVSHTSP